MSDKETELVTRAEFARRFGYNRSRVTRLVQVGKLPTHRRGKHDLIDPVEGKAALGANLDPAQAKNSKNGLAGQDATYLRARIELLEIQNREAQFDFDVKRRKYIGREAAERAASDFAQGLRDLLLNWPSRAAAELAVKFGTDVDEVFDVLDREVRLLLEEFDNIKITA